MLIKHYSAYKTYVSAMILLMRQAKHTLVDLETHFICRGDTGAQGVGPSLIGVNRKIPPKHFRSAGTGSR